MRAWRRGCEMAVDARAADADDGDRGPTTAIAAMVCSREGYISRATASLSGVITQAPRARQRVVLQRELLLGRLRLSHIPATPPRPQCLITIRRCSAETLVSDTAWWTDGRPRPTSVAEASQSRSARSLLSPLVNYGKNLLGRARAPRSVYEVVDVTRHLRFAMRAKMKPGLGLYGHHDLDGVSRPELL